MPVAPFPGVVSEAPENASSLEVSSVRIAARAAAVALAGVVLSGPLAVALIGVIRPQPPWQGAELFARTYHPVHMAPYLGGLVLVPALVILVASIHAAASHSQKARSGAALVLTAVFATLIAFNYVVQTTFMPALASEDAPGNAALIAALSMANPKSLAWALEMWGWGFFGVSTWLIAPVLRGHGFSRAAARSYVLNGAVSVLGALWTAVRPGWVMTPAGLVAYVAWNVLLAVLLTLTFIEFRKAASHAPFERVASSPHPTHALPSGS